MARTPTRPQFLPFSLRSRNWLQPLPIRSCDQPRIVERHVQCENGCSPLRAADTINAQGQVRSADILEAKGKQEVELSGVIRFVFWPVVLRDGRLVVLFDPKLRMPRTNLSRGQVFLRPFSRTDPEVAPVVGLA